MVQEVRYHHFENNRETCYYPNGELFYNYDVTNGLPHVIYYENGQLQEKKEFDDNSVILNQTAYHQNGQLDYIYPFVNGLKHGIIKEYDHHGNQIIYEEWENGKRVMADWW